jgi:hypothetical protein
MTVPRAVGLLAALSAVGIAVVALRAEQTRHTRRIQELQFRQVELRRQIWDQEMELARLRAPGIVRERAVRLGLETDLGSTEDTSPRGR